MEPDPGEAGLPQRLYLPHVAFNRKVGAFAPIEAGPTGGTLSAGEWQARKGQWLPTSTDKTFVLSLMQPVYEPREDRGLGRAATQRHQRQAVRLQLRPSVLSRTARSYERD